MPWNTVLIRRSFFKPSQTHISSLPTSYLVNDLYDQQSLDGLTSHGTILNTYNLGAMIFNGHHPLKIQQQAALKWADTKSSMQPEAIQLQQIYNALPDDNVLRGLFPIFIALDQFSIEYILKLLEDKNKKHYNNGDNLLLPNKVCLRGLNLIVDLLILYLYVRKDRVDDFKREACDSQRKLQDYLDEFYKPDLLPYTLLALRLDNESFELLKAKMSLISQSKTMSLSDQVGGECASVIRSECCATGLASLDKTTYDSLTAVSSVSSIDHNISNAYNTINSYDADPTAMSAAKDLFKSWFANKKWNQHNSFLLTLSALLLSTPRESMNPNMFSFFIKYKTQIVNSLKTNDATGKFILMSESLTSNDNALGMLINTNWLGKVCKPEYTKESKEIMSYYNSINIGEEVYKDSVENKAAGGEDLAVILEHTQTTDAYQPNSVTTHEAPLADLNNHNNRSGPKCYFFKGIRDDGSSQMCVGSYNEECVSQNTYMETCF